MNYVERSLMYQAEIEALIARRCGAEAENAQRMHLGQSLAYDEGAFDEISEELTAIAKRIKEGTE